MTHWVIIGPGRVGRTLALLAERLGIEATTVARGEHPEATLADGGAVFLTVGDDDIASVAAERIDFLNRARFVVHCSGSLPSTLLRDAGVTRAIGSVHPLLAIAEPCDAVEMLGRAAWSVEGDEVVVEWARQWLGAIGVEPAKIAPHGKPLYHAAAVASAGLVVALLDAAMEMARGAGMTQGEAESMLLPLARSTIDNLASMPARDALTGPVARGDDAVVELHRAALANRPELLEIYEVLTRRARGLVSNDHDDEGSHQ